MVKSFFSHYFGNFNSDDFFNIFLSSFLLSFIFVLFSTNIFMTFFLTFFIFFIILFVKIFVQKKIANKYDYNINYKINYVFFLISLFISFFSFNKVLFVVFGFLFLSPKPYRRIGNRYVNIKLREEGFIFLSGSIVNLFFIFISSIFFSFNPSFFTIFFRLNSFMLFFNLFPIPKFDGFHIFLWNRLVWLSFILIALFLLFYGLNFFISLLGILLISSVSFFIWNTII